MSNNYPDVQFGRRSGGRTEEDWQRLASAYDTWNAHAAVCEDENVAIDPDLKDFVRSTFNAYGLWNHHTDEPNLEQYRTMFNTLC